MIDFEFGGKLYKGKVLTPFVSMVIHGLLCLAHFNLLCLKCGVCLENILNARVRFNFIIILVSVLKNLYKVFLKIFA